MQTYGGSGEIRTHGTFRFVCFQDRCNKPDSATLPYIGATGQIRTDGFRDLQSLALGLSATVALFGAGKEIRTPDILLGKQTFYP